MRRKRLLWQLYPSYLLVTVLSLLVVTLYASEATRRFFRAQTEQVLESRARVLGRDMANGLLPASPAKMDAFCKEVGRLTDTRITVIKPDGSVLGDTDSTPATMENHARAAGDSAGPEQPGQRRARDPRESDHRCDHDVRGHRRAGSAREPARPAHGHVARPY